MPQTGLHQTGNEFFVMIEIFITMQHIAGVIVIALVRPCRNILTVGFYQILQITAEDLIQRMVIAIIGHAGDTGTLGQLGNCNIGQGFGLQQLDQSLYHTISGKKVGILCGHDGSPSL